MFAAVLQWFDDRRTGRQIGRPPTGVRRRGCRRRAGAMSGRRPVQTTDGVSARPRCATTGGAGTSTTADAPAMRRLKRPPKKIGRPATTAERSPQSTESTRLAARRKTAWLARAPHNAAGVDSRRLRSAPFRDSRTPSAPRQTPGDRRMSRDRLQANRAGDHRKDRRTADRFRARVAPAPGRRSGCARPSTAARRAGDHGGGPRRRRGKPELRPEDHRSPVAKSRECGFRRCRPLIPI